jgi:septum formation protein
MQSRIVLASSSPRRIELLRSAGLDPEVRSPEVDETPKRGESPRALVKRLAVLKARAIAERLAGEGRGADIVIAADTTVVSPDGKRSLGKPADAADAAKMLRALSGRSHGVLTAYCILSRKKMRTRVITSRVRMRKLDRALVDDYVASGEPMGKAGAYAIQGIGMALVDSISGSWTNVVGLPLAQVLEDLARDFGVKSRLSAKGAHHG